jgi:hypothetical protein
MIILLEMDFIYNLKNILVFFILTLEKIKTHQENKY